MKVGQVEAPIDAIAAFCQRWNVAELSLFGSALRDDFGPDSDVDVLLTFAPGGGFTFENFTAMQDELSAVFGGRTVDLVEKRAVRNPFIRYDILTTRRVIYAA
jgi:predicted nucleotidyltransferase